MRCLRLLILIALAWSPLTAAAHGFQPALPVALADAFQPDFYRRDLLTFNEVLGLDASQQPTIETLYGDYDASFRTGADKAKEDIEALLPLASMDEQAKQLREQEIQAKVAELMEVARQVSRETAEDADGQAARKQLQERAARIRAEIDAINAQPLEGDQLLEALAGVQPILDRWMAERAAIRTAFTSDVRAVLTAEQQARWPALERRLRRDKTLPRGRLSGESVNLFQLLNELSLTPETRAGLEGELSSYELQMDVALKNRNERLESTSAEWFKVMQQKDVDRALALAQEQVKLRVAVRSVNDQAVLAIADKLPSELAGEFTDSARMRGYPRVYRLTQTQRLLAAAQELPGVSNEVALAAKELETQYLAELKPLNDRLLAALRVSDPDELKVRLVRIAIGGQEDANPHEKALEDLMDKRTELGKAFEAKLEALLTPEQLEVLPKGSGTVPQD